MEIAVPVGTELTRKAFAFDEVFVIVLRQKRRIQALALHTPFVSRTLTSPQY